MELWSFFFLITFLLLVLFADLFATEGVLAVWLRSQLLVVALGLQSSGNTGVHHRSWLHFQFKNRFSLFVAILLLLLLLWFWDVGSLCSPDFLELCKPDWTLCQSSFFLRPGSPGRAKLTFNLQLDFESWRDGLACYECMQLLQKTWIWPPVFLPGSPQLPLTPSSHDLTPLVASTGTVHPPHTHIVKNDLKIIDSAL